MTSPKTQKTANAVIVQVIREADGAWKWAWRGRGRIRVAVVDTTRPHRKTNHTGYIKTLHCSGSVALGYPGGKWGFADALKSASALAQNYSAKHKLQLLVE